MLRYVLSRLVRIHSLIIVWHGTHDGLLLLLSRPFHIVHSLYGMRVMMALSMGANSNRVSTFTIAVNSSKTKSERFAVVAVANMK